MEYVLRCWSLRAAPKPAKSQITRRTHRDSHAGGGRQYSRTVIVAIHPNSGKGHISFSMLCWQGGRYIKSEGSCSGDRWKTQSE